MHYRPLGTTGITVSGIGFGTWGIGGLSKGATSYGPTDDRESEKALRRALEEGITFYDTANVYGNGHSEELLGTTFHNNRSQVIIATKAGYSEHNSPQDFSPRNLRKSLEESLRRLKTDYVDLYQLHDASAHILTSTEGIIETLKELQKEGKIRAFGASANSPNDAFAAIQHGFPVIQVNFNMIDQRIIDNKLMEEATKRGIGLIARTPFCFGFLSGTYKPGMFGPQDHRSLWSQEQQETWSRAPLLFAAVAQKTRSSALQLALRYCMSFPPVATVIPGMLFAHEVDENVKAANMPTLDQATLSEIRTIYQSNTFFIRPKNS